MQTSRRRSHQVFKAKYTSFQDLFSSVLFVETSSDIILTPHYRATAAITLCLNGIELEYFPELCRKGKIN